jgi:hypothetical protein
MDTVAAAQSVTGNVAANDDAADATDALRNELAELRSEMVSGLASVASAANRSAKVLENVSAASGGDAIAVGNAA